MADADPYRPPPASPGWMTLGALHPQTSWLFYAVARIRGIYVPLAVTAYSPAPADLYPERLAAEHRDDRVTGVIHGHQVASKALACLRILADPANRRQVRAEVHRASELYRDLPSVLLPELVLPERREDLRQVEGVPAAPMLPFIQACLDHGAASDPMDASLTSGFWVTMPLRTVYRRHPSFGAVVIDMTSPEDVGYGIVASLTRTQVVGPYTVEPHEGDPEDMIREQAGVRQVLVGDQSRCVLGMDEYLRLEGSDGPCGCKQWANGRIEADVERLGKVRTVGMEALNVIWPDSERTAKTLEQSLMPVQPGLGNIHLGVSDLQRGCSRAAVDGVIIQTKPHWTISRRPTLQRFDVGHWQMGAEAWVARLLGWLRCRDSKGRALACGPLKLDAMDAMVMNPKLQPVSAGVPMPEDPNGSQWKLVVVVRTSSHGHHRVQYCFVRRRPDAEGAGAWQAEDIQGFLHAEAPGSVDDGLLQSEQRVTRRAILAWPKNEAWRNSSTPHPLREEEVLEALSWEHDSEMILGLLELRP